MGLWSGVSSLATYRLVQVIHSNKAFNTSDPGVSLKLKNDAESSDFYGKMLHIQDVH